MRIKTIKVIPKEHWSVISFLEMISKSYIKPKIESIKKEIEAKPKLREYYFSAFQNINCILNQTNEQFSWTISKIQNSLETNKTKNFMQLIDDYGHYLFNSYYYVFSDDNEYLTPIVPGLENLNISFTDFETEFKFILQDIFDKKLPWRIYGKDDQDLYSNVLTYARQILPLKGGITPHYIKKIISGEYDYVKLLRPYLVNNFLGSLSILHKREDYNAGNVSAIIYPLIRVGDDFTTVNENNIRENLIGAFVLTSIIPNVFTDDVDQLETILNCDSVDKELLLGLKPHIKYSAKNIKTAVYDEKNRFPINKEKVRKAASRIVEAEYCKNSLLFSLTVSCKESIKIPDEKFRSVTIHFENLRREFESIFPTSPNLNPKYVSSHNNQNNINYELFNNHCKVINNVFSSSSNLINEKYALSILKAFKVILPEVSNNLSQIKSYYSEINLNEKYKISIFSDNSISTSILEELRKNFNSICEREEFELPDGENPQLIMIKDMWIRDYAIIKSGNYSKEKDFFNIFNLLANFKFRSIFLLKKEEVFLPRPDSIPKEFHDLIYTFAGFWLLQNICKIFTTPDFIKLKRFEGGESHLDYISYFGYDSTYIQSIVNSIKELSQNSEINNESLLAKSVVRALNFYGIGLGNFLKAIENVKKTDNKYLVTKNENTVFSSFYREYLREELGNTSESESFLRIFNGKILGLSIDYKNDSDQSSYLRDYKRGVNIVLNIRPHKGTNIIISFEAIESYQNMLLLFEKDTIIDAQNKIQFNVELTPCLFANNFSDCAKQILCYYNYISVGNELSPFPNSDELKDLVNGKIFHTTKQSSLSNLELLCELTKDLAFEEEKKNEDLLKKERELKKAWAHTIGNNLRYLSGLSNWSNKQLNYLINSNSEISSNPSILKISKWIDKLERESNLLYDSNEALYRFEREDIIYDKDIGGQYSLESPCVNAFFRVFLSYIYKIEDGKPEFKDYLIPYCGFDLNEFTDRKHYVIGLEDLYGNLEIAKLENPEEKATIEKFLMEQSKLDFTFTKLINSCSDKIESLFEKEDKLTLEHLVNFLIDPIIDNISLFESVEIKIDPSFRTNNYVAWSVIGFMFQEIWSNVIKYSGKDDFGKRSFKLIIDSNERENSFYLENTTNNVDETFSSKRTSGQYAIKMYIPSLLGAKKVEDLKVDTFFENKKFYIKAKRVLQ